MEFARVLALFLAGKKLLVSYWFLWLFTDDRPWPRVRPAMWLPGDGALSGPRQLPAVPRQLGEVLVQVEPAAATFGGPGGCEPPPGPVRERLFSLLYLLLHSRVSNERLC